MITFSGITRIKLKDADKHNNYTYTLIITNIIILAYMPIFILAYIKFSNYVLVYPISLVPFAALIIIIIANFLHIKRYKFLSAYIDVYDGGFTAPYISASDILKSIHGRFIPFNLISDVAIEDKILFDRKTYKNIKVTALVITLKDGCKIVLDTLNMDLNDLLWLYETIMAKIKHKDDQKEEN